VKEGREALQLRTCTAKSILLNTQSLLLSSAIQRLLFCNSETLQFRDFNCNFCKETASEYFEMFLLDSDWGNDVGKICILNDR